MVRSLPLATAHKLGMIPSVALGTFLPDVALDMICLEHHDWTSEFAFLQGLQEQNQIYPVSVQSRHPCSNY